jgi:hypothetical protein
MSRQKYLKVAKMANIAALPRGSEIGKELGQISNALINVVRDFSGIATTRD